MPHAAAVATVVAEFERHFGAAPTVVVRAPGRVNLLGAHVDYHDGFVMPAAVDRAIYVAARPAQGPVGCLVARDLGEDAALDPARLPPPVPERDGDAEATWVDYVAGVAWALAEAGRTPPAIDAVFGGDLPIGAGLSSSAALEVGFLLAWEALIGASSTPLNAARLAQRAENAYVGVGAGIMDPFASAHGRAGSVLFLDCRSLDCEELRLPDDVVVLVADSGVRRRLAAGGLDDRRGEGRRALDLLRRDLPGLVALRDVASGDLERLAPGLPPSLARRARHVVDECGRVRAGRDALAAGDVAAFGALMGASHRSSRDLYECSLPELDLLAETAWATPGCYGARLSGAGFGGCVLALVDVDAAEDVAERMRSAFDGRFGRRPDVFRCALADGAKVQMQ